MPNILHDILAVKKSEIETRKHRVPLNQLLDKCSALTRRISMKQALTSEMSSGIIAEFKRKSPSKGWINQEADPRMIGKGYEDAGAAAMSVLTDNQFFGGDITDLEAVRACTSMPLLRKDFIIDPYQIAEGRAAGADTVLLIAAALEESQCSDLADFAHELGLETLLEIHNEDELKHVGANIDMVGVNNRDLTTFRTDICTSMRLVSLLPADKTLVSESGISDPHAIKRLRAVGYNGFLIGETFMRTKYPAIALANFITALA